MADETPRNDFTSLNLLNNQTMIKVMRASVIKLQLGDVLNTSIKHSRTQLQ
jgi:hypothetical protein